MATLHSSIPSTRPQSHFPPILFSARDVALMISIAIRTPRDLRATIAATGLDADRLKAIADGRQVPNAAVLEYLQLERSGKEYLWHLR